MKCCHITNCSRLLISWSTSCMETTWTSLTKDIKPLLQTEIQFIILLSFDKKKKKKKKVCPTAAAPCLSAQTKDEVHVQVMNFIRNIHGSRHRYQVAMQRNKIVTRLVFFNSICYVLGPLWVLLLVYPPLCPERLFNSPFQSKLRDQCTQYMSI